MSTLKKFHVNITINGIEEESAFTRRLILVESDNPFKYGTWTNLLKMWK